MKAKKFHLVATTDKNPKWKELIKREKELYSRADDIRSPFARDYTRILHSMAYRRLKHKTQVFFNINNDHICTRMEHVNHVESVSSTIAKELGLNEELTKAISIGHDLGHAPFGHHGEKVLSKFSEKYLHKKFWHEQNGLRFVDNIELLEDNYRFNKNLDLTYAVRDGIISHCGEVDQNGLRPRDELIDLKLFTQAGQYQPATWEGCVVKLSDKIAYVGRDIEDAINLGFLDASAQEKLLKMARLYDQKVMNTTVIMHNMIIDICNSSSPENGIALSQTFLEQINEIKKFNYTHIYGNKRLKPYMHYSELIITEIFTVLLDCYDEKHTFSALDTQLQYSPILLGSFKKWLCRYCESDFIPNNYIDRDRVYDNEKIYGRLENKKVYVQAIIDYISGMSDHFAIDVFNELITY